MINERPGGKTFLRRQREAVFVAIVSLFASTAHAQQAEPDAYYRRGVELARAGDLARAREQFETAFELRPHPQVLYNLAKVALEMGDRRCALGYLRSYLQMDLTSVPEGQVKKARDALKALETDMPDGSADGDASCSTHAASTNSGSTQFGRDAASPSPNDAAVRRASAGAGAGAEESSPVNSGPAPAQGDIHTPSTIVAPTAAAPASVAPTPAGRRIPLESALLHVARPSPLPAALLMGTGISLLLGGVGVLLWSDGVHSELQSERTRLIADEPPQPTTLRALDDALAYERRVGENQAGFDSVQHLDVVGWTLVGVGAACAATGTWLFVNPPRGSARWTVSRRGLGVSW